MSHVSECLDRLKPWDDSDFEEEEEEYDSKVEARHRVAFMIGIRISCVEWFNMEYLKQEPFVKHKGKNNKPVRDLLKLELKHRDAWGTKNDKVEDLINRLKNKLLNNTENLHVQKHFVLNLRG